jgi:xylulokinase
MDDIVLAIDLGTSGCKAALVDVSGDVHAWAFREVDTILLPDGGAEQDPAAWWRAIIDASTEVLAKNRGLTDRVCAICANTQGEGTLPVTEDGTPLCNAILWMDSRGEPYLKEQMRGLVNISGYGATKLLRFLRLTGGAPSLTGKDPAGHMIYLREAQPEIFNRAHKFLNVLDYVNFKLCGRMVATYDSLLTSWVTDNRDVENLVIDPKLCALLGVPPEKIPEPVPCTEVLGEVHGEFARTVGLPHRVPVVAGAIDTSAAAVGSGAVADGDPHLYLGTSSWVAAHVPKKKTDIVSAIASVPCAVPGKYLMTALQATAGGNLTFLRDKVLYNQDALLQEECLPNIYRVLDEVAASAPAGANGVIYTPWIYGERAPVEDRHIRAGIHNLSLDHSRTDIVRAMFEGIAFNTRWVMQPVEKFLGKKCERLTVVGGGANSDVWCQIFADVLDLPVRQTVNPIEVNVRGSAYMAAAALGKVRFEDVPLLVKTRQTYEPRAKNCGVYDLHFKEFVNLYHATRRISHRLNAFHRGEKG